MKQKIRFEKNIKDGVLTVLESSEVDPGVVMALHEEEYDLEEVTRAIKEGLAPFMDTLRRRSLFPTRDFAEKIFDNAQDFFADPGADKLVVEYNDIESFPGEEDFRLDDDDDVELDALLEEDGDTKEDEIKEIDSDDDTPTFKPEDISEHEN